MEQRRRDKPAYQRLSDDLRAAIQEGRFGDGVRMPTEAELRREYGVSRHTIRQAFQDLVAEGLVYRVPGRGTFVTGLSRRGRYLRSIGTIEELMAWTGTEIEVLHAPATRMDVKAAGRLGLPSDEVSVLDVRRLFEGVPFVVTRIYLAIEGVSQDITAAFAPPELSTLIDCQPGEPILYVERIYFDTANNPVELAISHYNPRRYSYHLELRRKLP